MQPSAHRRVRLSLATLAVALLALGGPAAGQAQAELMPLAAQDGAAGDLFGWSVGISGDRAIVGAVGDEPYGLLSGCAYLFDVTSGIQLAKLIAPDGEPNDYFGTVAIGGGRALVGAQLDNDNGQSSGSVYVFDVATGSQVGKLLASDGLPNAQFGVSLAVSGDRAIVGAPTAGTAYLFDLASGTEIARLEASDGVPLNSFGCSVAIDGDLAVVGAQGSHHNGFASGSAYLFDATTGAELSILLPNDGASLDRFGYSVSISGDRAVVGAIQDDDLGNDSGSAYVFDVTTGLQAGKLLPFGGVAGDVFGGIVALSGRHAVVGSIGHDANGSGSGAAYLFDIETGQQLAKYLPGDNAAGDRFGAAVAISGDRVLVGAAYHDGAGVDAGAADLFDVTPGVWADLAGGTAGVAGIPQLAGTGSLVGGTNATLELSLAAPGAPAALFLSVANTPTAFHCGTLSTVPVLLTIPLTTSALGQVSVPLQPWPAGLPSGVALYWQYAIQDAAAVCGTSISNLLEATLP